MNSKTSKWKPENHATNEAIAVARRRIAYLREEIDRLVDPLRAEIKAAEGSIKEEQEKCIHVDEGGPFVATCSVCGWADWYDQ